jgi:hypothetical protein
MDASIKIRCDYEVYSSYQKGGMANLVIMKRKMSRFYVSLLRLEYMMHIAVIQMS